MITIKVCGPPKCGKTTLAKVIQQALQARGIHPHLSNSTAVAAASLDLDAKLESRIVTIDEIDDSKPPSDDDLCRAAVRHVLCRDPHEALSWTEVETALLEVCKRANYYLTPRDFVGLVRRCCESLLALGYKGVAPKV